LALTPGTRLGVYEILSPLGVGGMGEVYQAIDTNLKRQVAIKVLPASMAGDADRLSRFQREAEVLTDTIAAIMRAEPDWALLPQTALLRSESCCGVVLHGGDRTTAGDRSGGLREAA
jgi:hypothetical protein